MRTIFILLALLTGVTCLQSDLSAWQGVPAHPSVSVHPSFGCDSLRAMLPVSIALEMRGYGSAYRPGEEHVFSSLPQPGNPGRRHSRKSPVLAAALSLVLPGAGELYAGSYWLAGLFAALEGAGWYFNINERRLGDEKTVEFEGYADRHWSVVKYAEWLNENAKNFPGGENATHIDIDPNPALPPWERVDWNQLHQTEMAIPQFSHKLEPYGEQQYYELIGKYNQYSYGWDDKHGGDYWDASPRFLHYSDMRGTANDHYNLANTFVNLLVLNHVASAINAAWAAARFNEVAGLRTGAQLRRLPDGRADLQATATVSFHF
jgi:hypothetical protein